MKQSKSLVFHKNVDESCVYKKVSGSVIVFLVLFVYDILLTGNDVFYTQLNLDKYQDKRHHFLLVVCHIHTTQGKLLHSH